MSINYTFSSVYKNEYKVNIIKAFLKEEILSNKNNLQID